MMEGIVDWQLLAEVAARAAATPEAAVRSITLALTLMVVALEVAVLAVMESRRRS